MRTLLRVMLSRRTLGTVIGVAALCLVIAVFGDRLILFGDYPLAGLGRRLLAVVAVIAIWVAAEAFVLWRGRRADAGIMHQLMDLSRPAATDPDGAIYGGLGERLREIIAALDEERPDLGGRYILGLPWYLVMGPASSGKASLIGRSDLNMPFEERFGREGLLTGHTALPWRLWFTDQALFIGGPAALVGGDGAPEAVAQRSWRNMLGFLHRWRPRRPLDGVIVVLPVEALLAGQGRDLGAAIRRRLQEAMRRLAATLQVYVVINQCDRLPGFSEFFAYLDAEASAQPFGVTLPVPVTRFGRARPDGGPAALLRRLHEGLSRLTECVGSQLLPRAELSTDPVIRARMALFPEQLAAVVEAIEELTGQLLQTSRTDRPLMLRCLLLASAGQTDAAALPEADAWDGRFSRPVGVVARRPQPVPDGGVQPLFLNGIFRRLIIPEAGLAGRSVRGEARIALLNGTGYLVCLALLIAAAGWWSAEYADYSSTLAAMRAGAGLEQAILPLAIPANGLTSVLPALDEASHLAALDSRDTPAARVFGVSPLSISDARTAANRNYHAALKGLMLPTLLDALQTQLRQAVASGGNRAQVRSLLTDYLMMGDPSHYDRATVAAWAGNLIQGDFALDPGAHARAAAHLKRLLDLMPLPVNLDQDLIADARQQLRQQPDADAVYGRLKALSYNAPNAQSLDVATALGVAGSQLLMLRTQAGLPTVVPALYTRDGFYQIYLKQAPILVRGLDATDWVMGVNDGAAVQSAAVILQAVTNDYVRDYIAQWQSVISQIALRSLPDLPSLSGGLQTMAGQDSPLVQFITLIKQQTDLDPPPAAVAGLAAQATSAAQGVAGSTAASLLRQAANLAVPAVVPTDPQNWPGNAIRLPFTPLQMLLDTKSGQAPVLRVQNTLATAYGVVAGVASAQAPDAAAQQITGQVLSGQGADPLIALRVQAATLPSRWMQSSDNSTPTSGPPSSS